MAFTIRALIDGRDVPVCVSPESRARAALDLMFKNEFTQLAVVDASAGRWA